MKKNLHPKIHEITARCACGNSFETISTQPRIEVDICSGCHPLFTGQQKFVDTAGRIEKFQARYDTAKAGKKKKK
jgi:large subunit ribosomal protein L31